MKRSILAVGLVILTALTAPAATVIVNPWTPIFKGIDVASGQQIATVGGEPNLQLMCYRVDLLDPEVVLFTTPKCTNCAPYETLAENTSYFLEKYGVQVAINGAFYSDSVGPTDQAIGTPVSVSGLAISKGSIVSPADDNTRAATLLFSSNNVPTLIPNNNPSISTEGVYTAISGDKVLLTNGIVAQTPLPSDRDPRTAIGYSEDKRYLYLMTLDGRQTGWSEGADWATTGQWLKNFGAYEGINVDGGGSTTSVMADCRGKAVRLNSSWFVFAYQRERNIGHNFGVHAAPLPSELKNLTTIPGQTTANITWETDFDATTQVEYGATTSYGSVTTLDSRPKRRHVATLTGLARGSNYLFRAISTTPGGSYTQSCQFATTAETVVTELFGLTKSWKYTTNNLDATPAWKTLAYNDSAWLGEGPGLLYVLENSAQVSPRNTQMPPTSGTSIPRTYYFRTRFNYSGPTAGVSLLFSNFVDDGAVFYVNSTEVKRLRVPTAPTPITYATAANGQPCGVSGGDATITCSDVFTIGASNLLQGENIIAVEVHNLGNGSDLVFGSALHALSAAVVAPQLNIWTENDLSTLFWNGQGFLLQGSQGLESSNNWLDVPGSPQSPVSMTNSASTFYRLRN